MEERWDSSSSLFNYKKRVEQCKRSSRNYTTIRVRKLGALGLGALVNEIGSSSVLFILNFLVSFNKQLYTDTIMFNKVIASVLY